MAATISILLMAALGFALGRTLGTATRLLPEAAPQAASAPARVPAALPEAPASLFGDPPVGRRALENVDPVSGRIVWRAPAPPPTPGPLRVETTLRGDLSREIWRILEKNRVEFAHVIALDPHSGDVLAYLSTDPERFPPTRPYPAASLVKVITAAAGIDVNPALPQRSCRWVGNQYKLTRRWLDPPPTANEASLRKALAMSNNQCFARIAVRDLGRNVLMEALDRFGFLLSPAPGHAPGRVEDPGEDALALGRLGSGLRGTHITPLHAAQLAGVLVDGLRVSPRWVERVVDASGAPLSLPPQAEPTRVLTASLAAELREMLEETTRRGTARSAFHSRRGRPYLKGISVAGKTGSLTGTNPDGRYGWFAGVAPADAPTVALAVLSVHGDRYWLNSSQIALEVLKVIFCPKGVCSKEAAARLLGAPARMASVAGSEPR